MTDKEDRIEVDQLALGLTKSPFFMGVPLRLFFANMMMCTLICVDAHTFLGIPLFIIFHLLIVKFSMKEPHFFNLWVGSFFKTPPVLNHRFWGRTNSYEPW